MIDGNKKEKGKEKMENKGKMRNIKWERDCGGELRRPNMKKICVEKRQKQWTEERQKSENNGGTFIWNFTNSDV